MLPGPGLRDQVKDAWEKVASAMTELARYSEPPRALPEPNPPATARDLAELEQHLRLSLPPSYREFLLLHNGVRNFEYDMPLLSAIEIIAGGGAWVTDVADEFPDLARFPIAGSDYTYAGSYFLDTLSTSNDGEMEVVHIGMKFDVERWPNFLELLRDRIERLEIVLKAERADREKLED